MNSQKMLKLIKEIFALPWSTVKTWLILVLRILRWLMQAWPIFAFVPIGAIHYYLFQSMPNSHIMLHKIISSVFQCGGALIFLYSINDNMGTFRSKSLLSIVSDWLKAFPTNRKNVIAFGASLSGGAVCSGEGWVSIKRNTIEERIDELERQLEMHRELIFRKERELIDRIGKVKNEMQSELNKSNENLENLSKKIESSFIGGLKIQVFAVILAIYGSLVSIFA